MNENTPNGGKSNNGSRYGTGIPVSQPQRVVVTGGAGFLGSHLCEKLLREGYQVTCVDNLSSGRLKNIQHMRGAPGFELVIGDVTHEVAVAGAVSAIVHMAALASPRDYLAMPFASLRAGSVGTMALLEMACVKRARFVLASTSEVYGDPGVHPQPESYWGNVNPMGVRAVYDESKRFSEAATAAFRRYHGLDTGIVRIFNTFGPRMQPGDGRIVPTFITQALSGQPLTIHGTGQQTRSLCYVDDLIDGIVQMINSDLAGPVNLGNPEEMSVNDIALLVKELTGSDAPLTHTDPMEDDPVRRCPDIALARAALGWAPAYPVREGLSRTIAWFRGAGAEGGARQDAGALSPGLVSSGLEDGR